MQRQKQREDYEQKRFVVREAATAILGIIDRNINLDKLKEFKNEKEKYELVSGTSIRCLGHF